jgi:hypothetical protein
VTLNRHEQARRQRDEGMAIVDAAADEEWKRKAALAVVRLAQSGEPFIGDDVWDKLERWRVPEPKSLRALGPVMQEMARSGRIVKTGAYRESVRSNLSPKPLWIGAEHAA